MLDQIVGLILLGLGITTPPASVNVRGVTTASEAALQTTTSGQLNWTAQRENFAANLANKRRLASDTARLTGSSFRQKLATIRDTRKRELVEKLQTHCQDVYTKRTAKMADMLDKLSAIAQNITNSANTAASAGKNISSVTEAVTTAQSAIAAAQTAVTAQSGTTCVITFASESSLKMDVGKVISNMQTELRETYVKVVAARTAVKNAISALSAVTGEPIL